ncbi:hypothetical protein BU23DRAFT_461479 [Bimuria novae-zelandiae CBS 107.79]|uniref:RRM domain-containing protein n=1 Tax=Bimuria novae-zelandiae CBS 107.79 TaxID=1447943 RepID=A0A6A5VAU0_9PLEO|nr:hypothetical protein BU23DRAFT_461479 [Bimuria novae-zelandiae CBS 107.79]
MSSKAKGKLPVVQLPIIRHTPYVGLDPQPHLRPVFSNEIDSESDHFISRFVLVTWVPDGNRLIEAGRDHETELAKVEEVMKVYTLFDTCVPIYNRGIHLRFDNLQDACSGKVVLERHGFECEFVDNYKFAIAKSQDTAAVDEFEGQLRIDVLAMPFLSGSPVKITLGDIHAMHRDLEDALSRFGAIRDFIHTSSDEVEMIFQFRFEFFSVEVANRVRASLLDRPMERQADNGLWTWKIVGADNWAGPRPPNSPHRRLPRVGADLHQPKSGMNRPLNKEADQAHNKVFRERIEAGIDVRTTIMLRNIPNKLDWMTLKALLDRVCFGTYDFIYLRIDFASGHNVGYAFINFCDVKGMLAMLDQVEHRGWPGFRSSKNAELSYATIQGHEALVQKFRNSSVMQQTPYCRPRLFVTKEEAFIQQNIRKTGCEVQFPAPDNWSKFQRSIDSARTVGLFPPTASIQQPAERVHTSAYDRGTPRDMVHTVNQFGTPPAFNMYSDAQKRMAEQTFAIRFGPAVYGPVSFEHIPLRLIQEYLGDARPSNPGVIARPTFNAEAQIPLYSFSTPPQYGYNYYQE